MTTSIDKPETTLLASARLFGKTRLERGRYGAGVCVCVLLPRFKVGPFLGCGLRRDAEGLYGFIAGT